MSLKVNKRQKELIEKLGLFNEKAGMQPTASRIVALLIVSDKTELTFDEIRECLNISKSATSTALNLLITANKIEYITKPGERKRYFRSNILNWKEDMKKSIEGFTFMNSLLTEVLAQRPKSTKEFNNTLGEIIDFFDFFQKEIPGIFKKWESQK